MKTLEQLLQEIDLAPTVMNLSMEKDFCNELIKHQPSSIDGNWDILFRILNRLQESHGDAFYEMQPGDNFSEFMIWINKLLNITSNPDAKDGLSGIVSMFSMQPIS